MSDDDDTRPTYLDYYNRSAHGPEWPAFNPGWRKAKHEAGVAFFAPWEEVYAGFPEHARRCALALAASGPVHLRSARGGMQFQVARDPEYMLAFEAMRRVLRPLLEADISRYEVAIWQVIGEDETFHKLGGPPISPYMEAHEWQIVRDHTIVSTVFERDRLTPAAATYLGRVGQVWVASNADVAMLDRMGVPKAKIRRVPVPFLPDDPHLGLRDKARVPGPVRFYHIGKWEPRKCPHEMIGAFLMAFKPGEPVQLWLKTSERGPKLVSGYPESAGESIRRWLDDDRVRAAGWAPGRVMQHLYVIDRRLPPARLVQFHRTGDVYVSIARGEGFDMPCFDAVLGGKLCVYTPSGGPQDFTAPWDLRVEPSGTVACDPFYGWGEARYLDFELDAVVDALRRAQRHVMRAAWDQQAEAAVRARARHHAALVDEYAVAQVGPRMRQYVEEVIQCGRPSEA